MSTRKSSLKRQAGEVVARIFRDHSEETLTIRDVVRLAAPSLPSAYVEGVHENALRNAIGSLLRSSTFKTESGVKLRRYHSYRGMIEQDGKEKQATLWRDLYEMTHDEVHRTCVQLQKQAADTNQAAVELARYWNENIRPDGSPAVRLKQSKIFR